MHPRVDLVWTDGPGANDAFDVKKFVRDRPEVPTNPVGFILL
jgi:hypothetical protein